MQNAEAEGETHIAGAGFGATAPARGAVLTTSYPLLSSLLHTIGLHRLRRLALAAYFATLACISIVNGIPTRRVSLALIVIIALALTTIGRGRRQVSRILADWLPFSGVLILYDQTRKIADAIGLGLHESDVLRAETWCFRGIEPALWLQQHLYDPAHVYWYDALCALVYTSHFLATPVLAALLWLRDRGSWLHYIRRVIAVAVAGLATYCLFPEAPPWLAARDGLTQSVARLSVRGWTVLPAGHLDSSLVDAQNDGPNPVAAMPSLHMAFATLVAVVIAGRIRSRWRCLLALYPAAMAFTLVYCGEHYVLDLVAGVAYALGVHVALSRWEARSKVVVMPPL